MQYNQSDFEAYKNFCKENNLSACNAESLKKYYANNKKQLFVIKFNKERVIAKKPKYYSTWINPKTGNVHYLLTPAGKGKKYSHELKTGKRFTNSGQPKTDKNGNHLSLYKNQKTWRSGYLEARKDNANCYKARKAKRTKR